jgi:hypothetical protein
VFQRFQTFQSFKTIETSGIDLNGLNALTDLNQRLRSRRRLLFGGAISGSVRLLVFDLN